MLKLYYRIGGMPKVVSAYLDTEDFSKVAQEQAMILQGYRDDFRKYARKADWALLNLIFDKMGSLAGASSVKFSSIDDRSKSTQVRRAFMALNQAMIIHKILPTHTRQLPLAAHANDKKFKVSFLDIGLLHHFLGFDWRSVPIDADLTDIASGRFAEQFVSQEIITERSGLSNYLLHYWDRARPGSEAEVDFVVEYKGAPVPIEVKSGAKGRLRSLKKYCEELEPSSAFVLSQRNVERSENLFFLPLYLAAKL